MRCNHCFVYLNCSFGRTVPTWQEHWTQDASDGRLRKANAISADEVIRSMFIIFVVAENFLLDFLRSNATLAGCCAAGCINATMQHVKMVGECLNEIAGHLNYVHFHSLISRRFDLIGISRRLAFTISRICRKWHCTDSFGASLTRSTPHWLATNSFIRNFVHSSAVNERQNEKYKRNICNVLKANYTKRTPFYASRLDRVIRQKLKPFN